MKADDVFIATLPRSGSTLVGMMLGAHSQICHVGESAYWSKINVRTARCCCGTVGCPTLLEISGQIALFPNEIAAILQACGMIDAMEEPSKIPHSLGLSEVAFDREMFVTILDRCCIGLEKVADVVRVVSGKDIVVENSKYLPIARMLQKRNDRWKIIVVARDPRGIAFSSKKSGARKDVPRPVKDKLDLFLSFANRAAEMRKYNNVLLVRYEDLCGSTSKTLECMCKFLGVTLEERMLDFKIHKGHLLMGNHMMHDLNQEIREDLDWHEALSAEEKLWFTREDLVRAYAVIGYDLTKDYRKE